MNRRQFVVTLPLISLIPAIPSALAHHGWSSFDETRPLYLEGKITALLWQNPHVELTIVLTDKLALPSDLAKRGAPAQSRPVDGTPILAKAVLPKARGEWELELAPLTRVEAWKVAKPKVGDQIAAQHGSSHRTDDLGSDAGAPQHRSQTENRRRFGQKLRSQPMHGTIQHDLLEFREARMRVDQGNLDSGGRP